MVGTQRGGSWASMKCEGPRLSLVALCALVALVIIVFAGISNDGRKRPEHVFVPGSIDSGLTTRLDQVFMQQEMFYQEKVLEREKFLLDPKEAVKKTGNIYFLYEPYWWCPYGEQLNGAHGDGVKWTCGLPLMSRRPSREEFSIAEASSISGIDPGGKLRKRPPCVVYSAGSNMNSMFEDEVRFKTNCEIHIFDPAATGPSGYEPNDWKAKYSYHSIYLGEKKKDRMFSPKELMEKFEHSYVDIFKIDIAPNAEFPLFQAMSADDLSRIGQIQIEIHTPTEEQLKGFFSKLESNGFRIFHKEINLYNPKCCEYSLINTAWDPEFGFPNISYVT